MRLLLISLILVSIIMADDIARMESIVKDVGELRQKYEHCQDKLDQIDTAPEQCAVNQIELKERHQEILVLEKKSEELEKKYALEIEKIKDTCKELNEEKQKLEKEITILKTGSQVSKDKYSTSNANLKKELSEVKEKNTKNLSQEKKFPVLVMQEGYEDLQKTEIQAEDKVEVFDWNASETYRLKNEAKIYDGIDGNICDTWEEKRSFTSMHRNTDWIQITGYFIDKKWKSSRDESLWVKSKDAFKR